MLDREGAAVRPDEVVAALDAAWKPVRIHRTALTMVGPPVDSVTSKGGCSCSLKGATFCQWSICLLRS